MNRIVILVTFAYYLCAHVNCSDDANAASGEPKVSMLSSLTESNGGRVWMNATRKPTNVSGLCEIEETYEETVEVIDKIPFEVEVEVWCWTLRCTEMETRYREEKRTQNVTKTRKIETCCENHEEDPDTKECKPICVRPCENYGICSAPDTCKCEHGYEGKYCEIDPHPQGNLIGPNVCEKEELREETIRVVEQELVPKEDTQWCWPKLRCTTTKMVRQPVEKLSKIVKPHVMKFCCEGFVQNFMKNRCLPIALVEGISQQQQVQKVVD